MIESLPAVNLRVCAAILAGSMKWTGMALLSTGGIETMCYYLVIEPRFNTLRKLAPSPCQAP